MKAGALAIALVLCTIRTEAAIPHWRNSEALMKYALEADPLAPVPHIYKGMDLQYRKGDMQAAAREFRIAIRNNQLSWPRMASVECQADLSLGQIANIEGRPQEVHVVVHDSEIHVGHSVARVLKRQRVIGGRIGVV